MKAISILCFFFVLPSAVSASAQHSRQDSTVLLWPDGAPQAQGSEVTDKPALTLHFPAEEETTGRRNR